MRKAGIWFFLVLLNLGLVLIWMDPCDAGLSDLAKETSMNLRSAEASLQKTQQEIQTLTAESRRDLNNYKLYGNTLEQFKEPIAAIKRREDNFVAARDSYNSRVEAHNSQYGGRELPPDQYAISQRNKAKLDGEKASLSNILDQLKRDGLALERKIGPTVKEMEAIQAREKARSAQLTTLKSNFEKTQSRLKSLRQRMVKVCKEAEKRTDPEALEALKHCHSVNWDGAQQDLPPLNIPLPSFE